MDCSRVEEAGGAAGEMEDVPERKTETNSPHFFYREVLCQEVSQLSRRKLFKVETKHQVLPGLNMLHNDMQELIQTVQSASKKNLAELLL